MHNLLRLCSSRYLGILGLFYLPSGDRRCNGRLQCASCATLSGVNVPPGGILYDNSHWVVFLRAQPLLVPGQGFIVLKRHCEHLSELTSAELAALGPMLQRTQSAYDRVLRPAKVHFGYMRKESNISTCTHRACQPCPPATFP